MDTKTPEEIYEDGHKATVSTEHNMFTGHVMAVPNEYVVVTANESEGGEVESYDVIRIFDEEVNGIKLHNLPGDQELEIVE